MLGKLQEDSQKELASQLQDKAGRRSSTSLQQMLHLLMKL